jgi:hypothetical protein
MRAAPTQICRSVESSNRWKKEQRKPKNQRRPKRRTAISAGDGQPLWRCGRNAHTKLSALSNGFAKPRMSLPCLLQDMLLSRKENHERNCKPGGIYTYVRHYQVGFLCGTVRRTSSTCTALAHLRHRRKRVRRKQNRIQGSPFDRFHFLAAKIETPCILVLN